MRVCRVGAGGELCQMLFGNLEGWRLSVFYYRDTWGIPSESSTGAVNV